MADILTGWQGIAGTAIVISIILAGLALGIGRAFSWKKLEHLGADELVQAIVNAAILGIAVAISAMVLQVGMEFTPQMQNLSCAFNATNLTGPADYVVCGINSTAQSSFNLTQDLVRTENNLAYYQTLSLHFGNFSIQPMANLGSQSSQFSAAISAIQFSTFISVLNAELLSFITSGWFGIVFAAGLVLRSFFLTRKFGAFLIGASIAFIIFYPLMMLMFPLPLQDLASCKNMTAQFLSAPAYQTIPIVDLNDNNAIGSKLYNLSFSGSSSYALNSTISGTDFTGDVTLLAQKTTATAAALFFYCVVVPFFSLVATLVLIRELSLSFSGEIATEVSQL